MSSDAIDGLVQISECLVTGLIWQPVNKVYIEMLKACRVGYLYGMKCLLAIVYSAQYF